MLLYLSNRKCLQTAISLLVSPNYFLYGNAESNALHILIIVIIVCVILVMLYLLFISKYSIFLVLPNRNKFQDNFLILKLLLEKVCKRESSTGFENPQKMSLAIDIIDIWQTCEKLLVVLILVGSKKRELKEILRYALDIWKLF